jgi:hypothetical protein
MLADAIAVGLTGRMDRSQSSRRPAELGFLILRILILPVEHDPLKLLPRAAEFVFVLGVLDALQAQTTLPRPTEPRRHTL